ncbi:alpha/beta hydrolase fold domain-containing protein [Cellulomonas cellasea]|uniref:Alpha/beta hydrolase n=2 Tax=Cellulomonas cellasea TaxID=43670 RepID=A0A0A0B534_9CELL|nr:alpha/beta hydrolase fold domain-containing protein [Cellulomonas cellasea]KGM00914.1 alpha/beta hydrolase [Cellulomonas cellasea DSM 20118]GEA87009.1 alpha/beta hydrolase [Cellulomonas cellasea]
MSQAQLTAIDVALRGGQRERQTLAQQRAGFEQFAARPIENDVTVDEVRLGGVPALRLAPPRAAGAALLYLHGGGYVIGSARSGAGLAAALARRANAVAYSLDYRLAPEHPFPAAVEDGLAAYTGLLAAGHEAGEVVVAGDSAGGGLALALLLSARGVGLPQPAAVAVMSPWVDLTLTGESLRAKEADDAIFDAADVAGYAAQYLGDHDPVDPLASPVLADLDGLPPLLIQVGTNEVLLDDATRLAARAASAHVTVTLEVVARAPHVFQHFAGQLDEADLALDRAGRFLAGHLTAPGFSPDGP